MMNSNIIISVNSIDIKKNNNTVIFFNLLKYTEYNDIFLEIMISTCRHNE